MVGIDFVASIPVLDNCHLFRGKLFVLFVSFGKRFAQHTYINLNFTLRVGFIYFA
jgi:hypothetical protein